MKYLNLSGLTYFFNKVKTYVTSSTYLNSIGISNSDIDDIADDAGYSSGSLPASEDIFITGDIIPNTDNSVDLGASSKNIKMIYTKGITINGTQFLPSDYATLSGLSTVATSGSYNDLSNKPTIPTVNNATLTIQKNGANVQTFTANQSTNATANITVPTKTSDLTNDSGFITSDTTKIPLAGSNAISGDLIPATDKTYTLGSNGRVYKTVWSGEFYGDMEKVGLYSIAGNDTGYKFFNGGGITLTSKDYSVPQLVGVFEIFAANSGSIAMFFRGSPDGTLTWDGQPIQYTSDKRLKQQITEIDDKLLDAWEDVDLVQFKYNDAVEEKGNTARLHTGYVVQQIDEACKSHNVDISKYGLYCHEEYPEETEEVEVTQDDGTTTKKTEVVRPASEHYSLRYTEALIVECAYLRKCIKELRTEIEQLKSSK